MRFWGKESDRAARGPRQAHRRRGLGLLTPLEAAPPKPQVTDRRAVSRAVRGYPRCVVALSRPPRWGTNFPHAPEGRAAWVLGPRTWDLCISTGYARLWYRTGAADFHLRNSGWTFHQLASRRSRVRLAVGASAVMRQVNSRHRRRAYTICPH